MKRIIGTNLNMRTEMLGEIGNKLCNNIGRKGVKGLKIGDTVHATNHVLVISFKHRRTKRRGVKRKGKKKNRP